MKKVVMILICLAFCAYAQWSSDPSENLLISTGRDAQAIGDDEGGVIFAIWIGDEQVEIIRIAEDGTEDWRQTVSPPLPWGSFTDIWYWDHSPIAKNSSGDFFISFSYEAIPSGVIYWAAIKFDKHGNFPWGNRPIIVPESNGATGIEDLQAVAPDASGGCYIVWRDEPSSEYVIRAARLTSTGSVAWCQTISDPAVGSDIIFDGVPRQFIAWNETGDCYVTWISRYDPERVMLRKLGLSGPAWSAVTVATSTNAEPHCYIDGNDVIVAWMMSGSPDYFRANKYNASGNPQWGTGRTITSSPGDATRRYGITTVSTGNAFLVWQDGREVGREYNLYFKKFNSSSTASGGTLLSPPARTDRQSVTAMIPDGSGGCIIGWEDAGFANHAFVSRVSSGESLQWETIATTVNRSSDTELCRLSDGRYVAYFSKDGSTYAQCINSDGTLCGPPPAEIEYSFEIVGNIELGEETHCRVILANVGGMDSEPRSYWLRCYGSLYVAGPWLVIRVFSIDAPTIAAGDVCTLDVNVPWGSETTCSFTDPPADRINFIKADIYSHDLGTTYLTTVDSAWTTWSTDLRVQNTYWAFNTLALACGLSEDETAVVNIYTHSVAIGMYVSEDDYGAAGHEFIGLLVSIVEARIDPSATVRGLANLIFDGTCFIHWIAYSGGLRIWDFLASAWASMTDSSKDTEVSKAAGTQSSLMDPLDGDISEAGGIGLWSEGGFKCGAMGDLRIDLTGRGLFVDLTDNPDSPSRITGRYIISDWVDSTALDNPIYQTLTKSHSINADSLILASTGEHLVSGDTTLFLQLDTVMLSIREEKTPDKIDLGLYPNPFNSAINISYRLKKESNVEIAIFNINGLRVNEFVNSRQSAGYYQFAWEPHPLPSGIYTIRLRINGETIESKMIYLK